MTVWLWCGVSLLLWSAWAVFLFALPWGRGHEWWEFVVAVVLTVAALVSLEGAVG